MRHVIITPVKNESDFIENTIRSVVAQTLLPQEWVIVDDGSSDDTVKKVSKYLGKYDWINLSELETAHEDRAGGGKVVRAFNHGFSRLKTNNYDFLTKLDADLTLPEDYFKMVADSFAMNPRLGICGGTCYIEGHEGLVKERAHMYHVRGAMKSVRRECFEDIGGFKEVMYWDGIDEYIARHENWDVRSIDAPVVHHRPTSSAYKPLKLHFRNGYAARQRRSSFSISAFRAVHTMRKFPYFLNAIAYLSGYFLALLKSERSVLDKDVSRLMNQFDWMRMLDRRKFEEKYLK